MLIPKLESDKPIRGVHLRLVMRLAVAGFVLFAGWCGCGRNSDHADRERDSIDSNQPDFRIVSLSPALTDMLVDLGLEANIVGRDSWDQRLSDEVPRVGDLTNLNLELLISLGATDVVLQSGKQGLPTALEEMSSGRNWNIINVQIDGLDDVRIALTMLVDRLTFAHAPDLSSKVRERARDLLNEFDEALAPMNTYEWSADPDRRVLVLYGVNPPSAFGPGSYISDMLNRLGGDNALQEGGAWRELDAEALVHLDPWAIIILMDGPTTNTGEPADVGPLGKLRLSAVESGRCVQLSHPRGMLPGTSLIEVARGLRTILRRINDSSAETPSPTAGDAHSVNKDDR